MYTINDNILDRWKIFPLHSGVTSLNGIRPASFDLRQVSMSDINGTFHFNNKIKRYAYVADGSGRLCYNIGQGDDGTIMMRAFTDSTTQKRQYLFDGKDINGKTIGLYRDENLNLCIDYNGLTVETGLQFTTNEWHDVGLSFASRIVSNYHTGISMSKRLRLFLDGQVFETTLSNMLYNDLEIYIGQRSSAESVVSNLGIYQECYPLHGQIEMLAMNCSYNEAFTLQTLANELLSITKISEYDELGMLCKTDIHKAGDTILFNEYGYKTRSDNKYISQQISHEYIHCEGKTTVRSYETDALGRVTKITDGTFGNHSYKYNYRGFLEEADGERYAYDGNGNITQLGATVLTYDRGIKDKLISVGGSIVTYGNRSSLNPTEWKDRLYEYEGRRLIKYTTGGGYHEYTYNDQGQRIIKRKNTGETTKYYYAGDKLITEINPGTEINPAYRLDFLYDENGQLYGLIRDNASKFFYVKDFMNNILGIVNEDGTLVTKYNYTGFGKCKTILSSDDISWQNPFRFKGYYLDSESGMYYCHTRYYVPEWGRWLNADDNLSKANMFSYSGNNPVMRKQGSVSFDGLAIGLSMSSISNGGILSFGSSRVNWGNGGLQIPIWVSSLMSGSDFGASIAPALRTIYQYISSPGVKDLNKLYGLDFVPGKLNTVCSIIGYGLLGINIGLSAWTNFSNDNLTTEQQWISFGVDTAYTLGTFGIGYGVGALVSLIPGVGVFIAPFVSAGVTWFTDWTNKKWGWLDDVKQWFNDL